MAERIIDVNIETQSRLDSQAYAIYVARNRQLPYFIDGLKPVLRKILWCSAHDYGNQGFVKTAKVVGNVMAKYNPHGNSGVEVAIRNMVNNFSSKYPTMEGSGSWGTKVDPYAAQPRYNECKISKFALDVFIRDIKEDNRSTDWQANYDNKCMEPVYLPARIPTLLVLGQVGIAVGVKASIPSHNLGEVIDTTIRLMQDPNADFCLIPDECMPCEIFDTDWKKINETGVGNYICQGIIETGTCDYGRSKEHPCLIVRSLPDFTYFDAIKESIRKLIKSGKMPYIIDVLSKSGFDKKDPNKYNFEEIIVLKKGTDPNFVKEFLYTNTSIRQTRQVNLILIKDNNLVSMNYRDYLLQFIDFRRVSIHRRLNVRLQTLKTKLHETELYIKLLTSGEIENVIKLIRKNKSGDKSEIIEFLIDKLRVTPIQAKFLSNVTLPQLSAGYLQKYKEDRKKYEDEINEIINDLVDDKKIDQIIINEMLEIKEKYNDAKLCRILTKSEALGIAPGTFKLVFSKNNFIKKMNETDSIPLSKLANTKFSVIAENTEDVFVFTTIGKVFRIPVHKIQFSDPNSDGIDVRILNKFCTSNICCAASESVLKSLSESTKHKNFMFVLTNNGFIKKIDIDDILNTTNSGLFYSKVSSDDAIRTLLFGPDHMDMIIYSKNKLLRFSAKQIPYLRRSSKGNKAMNTSQSIDGMNFLLPQSTCLVVTTQNGFVNKMPLNIIDKSNKGKGGIKIIALKKNDTIANIWPCTEESKLIVRGNKDIKEIIVGELPIGSSISPGVKMFNDINKVVLSY